MKIALDTNILIYAEGVNGAAKESAVIDLLKRLPKSAVVLPIQTLGECFNVLVRKAAYAPAAAGMVILNWHDAYPVLETSTQVMLAAVDLAIEHQLVIWDALMLSAAASGGCRLLLSEDMYNGFTWNGVTVANPFAPTRHVLLEALLNLGT